MRPKMILATCNEHHRDTIRLGAAKQQTCARIEADESNVGIEWKIAGSEDAFDLMEYGELAAAKERYPPEHAGDSAT
jgi:hypothetical protein